MTPPPARANYRLTGSTLYVTIEPCLMCAGAFVHARIATVVFGAAEPRTGALESTVRAANCPDITTGSRSSGGVRSDECRALMQEFFRQRRGPKGDAVVASVQDVAADLQVGDRRT